MKQRVALGPAMSLALIQASSSYVVIFLDEFRQDYEKGLSKHCIDIYMY